MKFAQVTGFKKDSIIVMVAASMDESDKLKLVIGKTKPHCFKEV